IEQDPANWIGKYGNTALTGEEARFEQYSEGLNKWFSVLAFRPRENQFATIFEDITSRKRAEEEKLAMESTLRQTQKLESLGTMARGVAHEINNPLMGMINYADLIKERTDAEQLSEFAGEIMAEGQRIAKIVSGLLTFSRQETGTPNLVPMRELIDDSLTLVGSLLRSDQIAVELDIPEELPFIKCRRQQIQQVLINLLVNAQYYLNERYPAYDEDKILRIVVCPFEENGTAWIRTTVEDHGDGIPDDVLPRIFDPFFSTKPRHEGPGLGLSVSFGIIEEHEGRLTAESILGETTRIHMDLLASVKEE
ncbi:hybrid sensor histidine kinase/response regulator, partial [Candidatus Bipolaricaulota bacterium]|nr:hybrid sensor histidine kinase/response regulator [Candidatus Bipolaricaulota bacterium]